MCLRPFGGPLSSVPPLIFAIKVSCFNVHGDRGLVLVQVAERVLCAVVVRVVVGVDGLRLEAGDGVEPPGAVG